METMISRETILNAIRYNLPQQRVEHPVIPGFAWTGGQLKEAFVRRLEEAGVAVCGGPVVQPLAGRTEAPGSRN